MSPCRCWWQTNSSLYDGITNAESICKTQQIIVKAWTSCQIAHLWFLLSQYFIFKICQRTIHIECEESTFVHLNCVLLSIEHRIVCLTLSYKTLYTIGGKLSLRGTVCSLKDFTSCRLKYPGSRVFLSNKQYSDYKVKCWQS